MYVSSKQTLTAANAFHTKHVALCNMTGKGMRVMLPFRSSSRNNGGGSTKEWDWESVPKLIINENWERVMEMMASNEAKAQFADFVRRNDASEPSQPVETILHLSCRFHPPLSVIKFLFDAYPRAAFEADRMGRYPVHLAVKEGASPLVIRFLLLKNPDAAKCQDIMEKTPLHLACESYALTYDDTNAAVHHAPSVTHALCNVVQDLCNAAPDCVNVEDMDEMSALEHAIASDCPIEVVKKLQKQSERQWKTSHDGGDSSTMVPFQADLIRDSRPLPSSRRRNNLTPVFGSRQRSKKSSTSLTASSA